MESGGKKLTIHAAGALNSSTSHFFTAKVFDIKSQNSRVNDLFSTVSFQLYTA